MIPPPRIHDRGRGPELVGTRVTVYDIIPYLEIGEHPTIIAADFNLGTEEVAALIRYIEEHKEAVMAENARIEERIARGNPPEVEERLKNSPHRARLRAAAEAYERKLLEQGHAPEAFSEGG